MKLVGLALILLLLAGCIGGSDKATTQVIMDEPRDAPSASTFSANADDYVFSVLEFYHGLSSGVQDSYTINGDVGEVIHTDRYTYMKLVEGEEELWVATSRAEIPVGANVIITGSAYFDFQSSSLNKTFPVLILAPTYSIVKDGEVISGTSDAPSMGISPH
jgi:hypothetical protein